MALLRSWSLSLAPCSFDQLSNQARPRIDPVAGRYGSICGEAICGGAMNGIRFGAANFAGMTFATPPEGLRSLELNSGIFDEVPAATAINVPRRTAEISEVIKISGPRPSIGNTALKAMKSKRDSTLILLICQGRHLQAGICSCAGRAV
jgi:hypothetical protein